MNQPPGTEGTSTSSHAEENGRVSSESGVWLLDRAAEFVRRYVVVTEEQADILALWVMHTHAFDAAETTPYLEIVSAEKRSGKSRLLEVLETIVARPWFAGRVTSAVLARKIQAECPTLLLDESDAAFKGDKEYSETVRGILNAGFRTGGAVSLCVGQGANITYADLTVFSPKAIAGLGKLPDTISDRSIRIELKRRTRDEPIERFRLRLARGDAEHLRIGLAVWAQKHLDQLSGAEPPLPEELDDRAQDIVEPLLAIADAVGGGWPKRARRAVLVLAGSSIREDADSLGVRLLRDIKRVFEESGADRLRTTAILTELNKMDDAPWGSLRGAPLDSRGLARILKPYKISRVTFREGEYTHKGYKREQFEDAWARYVTDPPEGPEDDPPGGGPRPDVTDPVTDVTDHVTDNVTDKNGQNPLSNADVTVLPINKGGSGGDDQPPALDSQEGEAAPYTPPHIGNTVTHRSEPANRAENDVTDSAKQSVTSSVTQSVTGEKLETPEQIETYKRMRGLGKDHQEAHGIASGKKGVG